LSKNTRWALAIVGVVVLIVAAVVIGTGGDETTDAVEPGPTTEQPSERTTTPTPATGQTGSDDSGSEGDSGSSGSEDRDSGGASPDDDSNSGSGGASPNDDGRETGGATTSGFSSAPLLVPGKVRTISVDKGDTVYIRARTPNDDELHIHGYDKTVPTTAGEITKYKFKANLDGVYEIELHGNGELVATLKVNP
jgi:hypothetical protein